MSNKVLRPKADDKRRVTTKEDFELCYLRHRYVRKTRSNPTKEEMAPYEPIIKNQSYNSYGVYDKLFESIGLGIDDIKSIGRTHLVSFLGLFAIKKGRKNLKKFKDEFWKRNGYQVKAEDILDKNKANFTIFLNQRFEELVRICRQKVRDIKGIPLEEYKFFVGTKRPPAVITDLLTDNERLGYKRLDPSIFRTIKNRAKVRSNRSFYDNGKYYIVVPVDHPPLSEQDFVGVGIYTRDNTHNQSPASVIMQVEDTEVWESKKKEFNGFSRQKRSRMLKEFIQSNSSNSKMREELALARSMLRSGETING